MNFVKSTILLIFKSLLVIWICPSIAQGIELEGRYIHDIENFILFEGGMFREQYVTDEYIPPSYLEDPDAPGPERETICLAKGSYTIMSADILLSYEIDSCNLKSGLNTVHYEVGSDTVIINGKDYRKEDAERRGMLRLESAGQTLTTSDRDAGVRTWQWHTAQAMQDLNNNNEGIWYCSGLGSPQLDTYYWVWSDGANGWIPNAFQEPSIAIDWYFGSVSASKGCTDCLMAARATFYKGLQDAIGTTLFNSWFRSRRSDLVISNLSYAPSSTRKNKSIISSEDDLERGDWVYFQNWVSANVCPKIDPMQGENAITQNSTNLKTYIGLGIPGRGGAPVTGKYILDYLLGAWQNTGCPQQRESKLLLDNVVTTSAAYFEDITTDLPLKTLQNNVPVNNQSDYSKGRKFYKFVVPSGISSFEIRTSGGTGDVDLYIIRNQWPTKRLFDFKSDSSGNSDSVKITDNPSGVWYVMLDAYKDYSGVTIVAAQNSTPPQTGSCVGGILFGRSVSGNWDSGCSSDHRSGSYAKYYSFYLSSSREVTIDLKSSTDPYLYLLDGRVQNGSVVIGSNDDSNGTRNSQIVRTLSAGTYTVEATTYSSGATGGFTLLVQ